MGGITTTLFQRPRDPQFNNTTLLLSGNFPTNGAQNNTFLDSSSNGFSITRNGNTTQGSFSPFSQTGWSNYFNGSTDFLNFTAATIGTNSFTIEAWVYLNSNSNFSGVFSSLPQTTGTGVLLGFLNTGVLFASIGNGGSSTNVSGSTAVSTNTWHHVALVRNGSALTLYLNGTSIGTGTSSANITQTSSMIGRYYNDLANYYLNGYISNLRVVNGTAVYTANFTPPTAPLTAITNTMLLTCQSNRFVDNSSNPYALTVNGTPSIQAFSPFVPSGAYTTTAVGGSGYFDGTGDYLSTNASANAAFQFSGDFTVECWIYTTSTTAMMLFDTVQPGVSGSGASRICFYVNSNQTLGFFTNNTAYQSSNTIQLGAWNHVVLMRSGTTQTMYINGVQGYSATQSGNYSSGYCTIGFDAALGGTSIMNGYMQGMRVIKGQALASGNFTPPTSPVNTTSVIWTGANAATSLTGTVSLLLNFTNAGIVDSTAKNVLETVGNAQISTAVSRFGGSSMSFDGTTDYVVEPTNVNFGYGTGDFTIEFWLRLNSTALQTVVSNLTSDTSLNPHIYIASGGSIRYYTSSADRITGATLSTNQWYHIAVCRSGTSTRLFIDGTQSGSTYTDSNNYGTTAPLGVGTYWASGTPNTANTLNGYIDDLRISKVARYTANFNVPTIGFTDR